MDGYVNYVRHCEAVELSMYPGAGLLTLCEKMNERVAYAIIAAYPEGKKRPSVVQAKIVVKVWLTARRWKKDPSMRTKKEVWVNVDETRRVTFSHQNLHFEKGGRGKWEKDYVFHRYAKEVKTIAMAENLYKSAKAVLPETPGKVLRDEPVERVKGRGKAVRVKRSLGF